MLDLVKVSIQRLAGDRKGISAVEYGILGAVVVVAVVAVGPQVGSVITSVFSVISGKVPT